jgi:CBS domain containing-hemolysin-like protein
MGDEPRRTRLAAVLLRALVLAALLACIALAPPPARLAVATAAALGLALILLLGGLGWLRREGWLRRRAASIVGWLVAPCFLLLPRRDQAPAGSRDTGDSIADLADALVAEPAERQGMVEALLGLERRHVEDVMVPRSEIDAIDATAPWDEIAARLCVTAHTRMPLFDGDLDRVHGIVHMRLVLLGRIDAHPGGGHVVPGALSLREINRRLGAGLPMDGPRTLSGLIVERLESIPEPGATLRVGATSIEVLQVAGNAVRTARLRPAPAGD